MMAFLVLGPYSVASYLKPYAAIPIVLNGHWRSLVWAGIAVAVTVPLLPWSSFLAHIDEIPGLLASQTRGGLGAHGILLQALTLAALVYLGRALAAWLVVPALWPATAFQYQVMAIPAAARLPLVAATAALPMVPDLIAWGVVATAGSLLARSTILGVRGRARSRARQNDAD